MNLLILDDQQSITLSVKALFQKKYNVLTANKFDDAVKYLEQDIDIALIDINLDDREHNGIDFLKVFKKEYPDSPAIMISSLKEIPKVVECIKLGAEDYLEKPMPLESLEVKVESCLVTQKRNKTYSNAFRKNISESKIVGQNFKILSAVKKIEDAQTMRILIFGETGVGKTPFARHSNLHLSKLEGVPRPFEHINCAGLTKERFHDELFGHKKGAFTSAIEDKKGLVELAKGGELFLDEIGDLSLDVQADFLTFLDTMEYYRLGDHTKRKAEIRIICATNRNLKEMVKVGKFRKDLYSRIAQVEVSLPPLRERKDDIKLLVEYFINVFAGYSKTYNPQIVSHLEQFDWEEGNVRELKDAVEYACITARNAPAISFEHLPEKYYPQGSVMSITPTENFLNDVFEVGIDNYLNGIEKKILTELTTKDKASLQVLADRVKMSKPTLFRKLKKYGL